MSAATCLIKNVLHEMSESTRWTGLERERQAHDDEVDDT